jgi:Fic family protein
MTKRQIYNIKQDIEEKRKIINALLNKHAKHLDDIAWIKGAFIKESLVLNQCSDKDIRYDTCSDFIQNINGTWDTIVQQTNKKVFKLSDIMDIHYNLTKNTDIIPCSMRTKMVYALSTPIPAQSTPEITRQYLDDILYRMNNGKQQPLQRAFDAHYEIIILQPFKDFNKRTARMIMNWFLISKGYRPIAFNYATDNQEYMNSLRCALNGDKKAYYGYMYKCMLRTQQDIIRRLTKSKMA